MALWFFCCTAVGILGAVLFWDHLSIVFAIGGPIFGISGGIVHGAVLLLTHQARWPLVHESVFVVFVTLATWGVFMMSWTGMNADEALRIIYNVLMAPAIGAAFLVSWITRRLRT